MFIYDSKRASPHNFQWKTPTLWGSLILDFIRGWTGAKVLGVEIPVADLADAPDSVRFSGMIPISGGTFRMGSNQHYPEEAPVHRVTVGDFRIDRYPVTNRQFKEFVRATGHVTFAEIAPDPKDYPGALPHMLYAGSLVFTPTERPVDLRDWSQWWVFLKGADWRHPYGPDSSIDGLDDHPVVHIAPKRRATIPACPTSGSPAESSKAALTCARRTTAAVIALPLVTRSRSIRRPVTSDLDASCVKETVELDPGPIGPVESFP